MSTSKLIEKPAQTAYERWELPNVQKPGKAKSKEEAAAPLTAEQIEVIQQEAYAEGFEQGRKEGREAGQKDIEATLQRLEQIIHAFSEPLEDLDEQVSDELGELALAIARQIIRREIKNDPGQVVAVVREALAALPSATRQVEIQLHPDDAALVREALLGENTETQRWRIVDDPRLSRGGCRIQSEHSRIDATVEQQLNAIAARILGGERKDDLVEE